MERKRPKESTNRSQTNAHGMTLIELIISMGLSSMLLAFAWSGALALWSSLLRLERLTYRQTTLSELYMELETDIKNAGSDPLNQGLFDTTGAVDVVPLGEDKAGSLLILSDFTGAGDDNADGDFDDEGERIIYSFNAAQTTLYRWVDDGAGNLVQSARISPVVAFTFALEDADGKPASGSDAVQVEVAVSLASDADNPTTSPRINQVWRFGIRSRLAL